MYLSKEGRKNKKKVKIKGILIEKKVGNSGDRRRWQQGNGSGVQMEGVR